MLRDRGEVALPEESLKVAKRVKQAYSYLVKEIKKYDQKPNKVLGSTPTYQTAVGGIEVEYERSLGPEIFFNPEIFSTDECRG
ncbi:hypothetical protein DVH05_004910 [Phytophthora capsici]|nr:hypothetical protein DVH05_004910 [Phytophthora capsici]